MKTTDIHQRTLTVPLSVSEEQRNLFIEVIKLYNKAWGDVVAWCNENQTTNKSRAQKELYHKLRGNYPQLPAQFISIVLRDAVGSVKSWNSNRKKERWAIKSQRRRLTLNYDLRIMSLRGNLLSLSSLQGNKRQKFLVSIPQWFADRYPEAKVNAAKLSVKKGRVLIHLIYRVEPTDTIIGDEVVGVDRGIKNVIVTSQKGGDNRITSAQTRGVKRRYAYNRATLQAKGTRSAKRRLNAMSGREKRFISDANHQISKALALDPNVSTYVLEDLTGINKTREKSRRKLGKKMRTWMSGWSYFELEFFLSYKCKLVGKKVEFVLPAYTSQRCNQCGFTDRKNRNGSHFDCRRCGYSADADWNAACNIRDKYLFAIDSKAGCSQPPMMDEASELTSKP